MRSIALLWMNFCVHKIRFLVANVHVEVTTCLSSAQNSTVTVFWITTPVWLSTFHPLLLVESVVSLVITAHSAVVHVNHLIPSPANAMLLPPLRAILVVRRSKTVSRVGSSLRTLWARRSPPLEHSFGEEDHSEHLRHRRWRTPATVKGLALVLWFCKASLVQPQE